MIHKMEKTPRILTKIGLVFEFVSVIIATLTYFYLDKLLDPDYLMQLDPTTTQEEIDLIIRMEGFFTILILIGIIVGSIMFMINYYFFTGLYKERYTEEKAKKVYTYQFIYGIVCLFSNAIIGVLYLVSGNQGRNGRVDRPHTREGI